MLFRSLLGSGQRNDVGKTDITVGEWVPEWLMNYARPRVRDRTLEKYKSCLENYILSKFRSMLLRDITSALLQKHFNSLLANGRSDQKGLSPSTIGAARRYFAQCLDDAIKEGIIIQNPARMTKPPRLVRREIVVLTKDEAATLVENSRKIKNTFMRVMMPELISFVLHTGLRQGEAFGMKWEDVDFENSCIFVKRSLAHVVGKGAVLQETKTKTSRRRVLLLQEDVTALKEYQKWQQNYADELGDKFNWSGLVFTSPFGSPISPTNFARRYFHPLLKQCGITEGFTFHGLRHTHATLLLQQGVNPKIVQERLGHRLFKTGRAGIRRMRIRFGVDRGKHPAKQGVRRPHFARSSPGRASAGGLCGVLGRRGGPGVLRRNVRSAFRDGRRRLRQDKDVDIPYRQYARRRDKALEYNGDNLYE